MAIYVGQSSAVKTATAIYVGVSSAVKTVTAAYANVGGTIYQVWPDFGDEVDLLTSSAITFSAYSSAYDYSTTTTTATGSPSSFTMATPSGDGAYTWCAVDQLLNLSLYNYMIWRFNASRTLSGRKYFSVGSSKTGAIGLDSHMCTFGSATISGTITRYGVDISALDYTGYLKWGIYNSQSGGDATIYNLAVGLYKTIPDVWDSCDYTGTIT